MAIKKNQSKINSNAKDTFNEVFRHIRINPETGQTDYYFPLEITHPSIRTQAKERGLEISRSRLGNRIFDAVMIPCKNTTTINGKEVFIDTPPDIQRQRYLEYIRDELAQQEAMKQDGRCNIPDGRGGLKRCPLRIPNPAYVPGSDMPKTRVNKCGSCPFELFKQAHTIIEMSCLDTKNEVGETIPYESPTPCNYYSGNEYVELADEFVTFVRERKPKLAPLAEMLVREYKLTEASEELGKSTSTTFSQKEKLQELLTEFLDIAITL